jgi:hypothetical protein
MLLDPQPFVNLPLVDTKRVPANYWQGYLLSLDANIRFLSPLPAQVATNTANIATNTAAIAALQGFSPQVSGALVASPTGTTSATGVMLGLSNTAAANIITPAKTGRVLIMINGVVTNSAAGDGAFWHIRTGTGAAPANGAAPSGTQSGGQQSFTETAISLTVSPFAIQAIVTGLALATPVWIDLVLGRLTGGTATMTQVNTSAIEV